MLLAVAPLLVGTITAAGETWSTVVSTFKAMRSVRPISLPLSDISRVSCMWYCDRWGSTVPAIFVSISTASTGYFPIADSPESITQSVPSRTALATSVASARVGSRLVVIDSSIWVAVITGFPRRFAFCINSFWTRAICSMGISTPRSPRATIMPSAASSILFIWSRAPDLSILAIMNGLCPRAFAASRTALISSAVSTKDWLTASTPCSMANLRHSWSFSVNALMPKLIPGRLSPLRERSSPPTSTWHFTSLPSAFITSSWTYPSLRKSLSPGFTTWGRGVKLTETRLLSPIISSVVRVKSSPAFSSIGSCSNVPIRILGPERSAMIATRIPAALDALRRLSMTFLWLSKSPCEKLRRATFMPALIIFSIISDDWDAGPMVQTILVLLSGSVML